MIQWIQSKLQSIYALKTVAQAERYLISPEQMSNVLQITSNQPQVLFSQEDQNFNISIYVGSDLFQKLQKNPMRFTGEDIGIMTEEVSHFTYLLWSLGQEKKTSLLDLEIQGEIDKFILLAHQWGSDKKAYQHLFLNVSWRNNLNAFEKKRYEFAHRIIKRLVEKKLKGSPILNLAWLRKFYRLPFSMRMEMLDKCILA